ncbi:unnamed protein product [Caenorhabditis sp. 36 PRJEB53466]|nr:unnamed protein product [Caenorhabditis sp. 36 PRJEB53466]
MIMANKQAAAFAEPNEDYSLLLLDDFVRTCILDPTLGFSSSKVFSDWSKIPPAVSEQMRRLMKAYTLSGRKEEVRNTIHQVLRLFTTDNRTEMITNNYLRLFDIETGITVAPCFDYHAEGNVGMKLISTKDW